MRHEIIKIKSGLGDIQVIRFRNKYYCRTDCCYFRHFFQSDPYKSGCSRLNRSFGLLGPAMCIYDSDCPEVNELRIQALMESL